MDLLRAIDEPGKGWEDGKVATFTRPGTANPYGVADGVPSKGGHREG